MPIRLGWLPAGLRGPLVSASAVLGSPHKPPLPASTWVLYTCVASPRPAEMPPKSHVLFFSASFPSVLSNAVCWRHLASLVPSLLCPHPCCLPGVSEPCPRARVRVPQVLCFPTTSSGWLLVLYDSLPLLQAKRLESHFHWRRRALAPGEVGQTRAVLSSWLMEQ